MSKSLTVVVVVLALLAMGSSEAFAISFGSGGSGGAPPQGGRVFGLPSGRTPGTPPPSGIPWSSPVPPPKPTGPGAPGAPAAGPSPTPGSGSGEPSPTPTPSSGGTVRADETAAVKPLKPTLMFFAKYAAAPKPGVVAEDEAVKATLHYFREVFRAEEIVALAREFRCILVDVRKLGSITSRIPFRTSHAPTLRILDLDEKSIYFTTDPGLSWQVLAVKMKAALKKVEGEVKKIARSREDSPLVDRAKARVAEIEMREEYNKGLDHLLSMKWGPAESCFRRLLKREEDCAWKEKAEQGLKEIEAGKLVAQAQRAVRARQTDRARELLRRAMEIKEARLFGKKAREILKSL